MDAIDKSILKLLQENARMPIKDIAAKVALSSPAVSTRIAKLEREGLIRGYEVCLDREKLGYLITAYVEVEMEPSLKPKFHKEIENCKNVLECCGVTGQYSQILKAAFRTTRDLEAFLSRVQTYGKTSTHIVLSPHVPARDHLLDAAETET